MYTNQPPKITLYDKGLPPAEVKNAIIDYLYHE